MAYDIARAEGSPSASFLSNAEYGLAAIALILYFAPLFIAPTTYPGYYEDESWVYLPTFELLRGNGVSYGAFDQGQIPNPLFSLISAIPVALSPFDPELTVRIISLCYGLICLTGVYALTRKLAPRGALFAAAAFLAIPMLFLTSRYGRIDFLAAGLGLWSFVAAVSVRPLRSGALAAMAIFVHPLVLWILLPGLCWLWQQPDRRVQRLAWYGAPVAVAGALQGTWLALNWQSAQAIVAKYFVTTSMSGSNSFARVLDSLLGEASRYGAYWQSLVLPDQIFAALLATGALIGAVMAVRAGRWPVAVALGAVLLGLAVLVGRKIPFYLVHMMPMFLVAAGIAAGRAPRSLGLAASALLLIWIAGRHTPEAFAAANTYDVAEADRAMAALLPRNAVVVSTQVYAGLVRSRPDLRYYAFHALSDREGWKLPQCSGVDARLRELIGRDQRASTLRAPRAREAFFIEHPMGMLNYLHMIYVDADQTQADCLTAGEAIVIPKSQVCRNTSSVCFDTRMARRSLP